MNTVDLSITRLSILRLKRDVGAPPPLSPDRTLNNKTLNSEIETNRADQCLGEIRWLSITRLSILRLKRLHFTLIKDLHRDLSITRLSILRLKPVKADPSPIRYAPLNNKTLNSEIETD